jgi:hypothetical protein
LLGKNGIGGTLASYAGAFMASRGSCKFCGEERQLNGNGLCTSCKGVVPCAVHSDLYTIQRCRDCRNAACAFCLSNGVCEACRIKRAAEGPVKRKQRDSEEEKVKSPWPKIAGLGVVLMGVIGFNVWLFSPPPATAGEASREGISTVQKLIMGYAMTHHAQVPKTLVDIAAIAAAQGVTLPVMLPRSARAIPNAVVYSCDGKHYLLQINGASGKAYTDHGKVVEVRVP